MVPTHHVIKWLIRLLAVFVNFFLEMLSEAKGENQKTHNWRKEEKKLVMFASKTTMEGWRMTIKSAIDLTEECFIASYGCVLSGKWNQDSLEVITFCQKDFLQS